MKKNKYPIVMTIAGFDGSGGAGIQADIKTASALGCFSTSVLTALPIQNTQGVRKIYPVSIEAVKDQIASLMEDVVPDAIKIGMVHTSELVETIVSTLANYKKVPIVFDPVMVATSGHRLIEEETLQAIIKLLIPLADLITPNMDESAVLAKTKVKTLAQMKAAGMDMKALGCKNILLKGGHQESTTITSLLVDEACRYHAFEFKKIDTDNTHGSGCTLSSAIASFIARGKGLHEAVALGQQYVFNAIENGADVQTGAGNGPLNHFFDPHQLIKREIV
ncbi:bifunctional hydroxymethylpyrimidine kinase/phosphomethylpyrimidine kinase [Sphingobacterium gobiense]|uniref:hydroxymethylpyrimidine kinase n=1 Tax=Sphingobacterium gobiense TaxID=1382456 RepID=A0A2S9JSX4_9SPHI|nr:bifunctional hydroxymethylpyrimidine kinase/phosphomethylpyrimidine kinase [Sphingobacterium gobiense]PRD56354.1 bifunctional hydroxymethylpyrimidine kinase/phosphomethylpyrimidine kinase [Sphingobacterium gobiense]